MNAQELVKLIAQSKKKTPVKVYVKSRKPLAFPHAKVFGSDDVIVIGDYEDIKPVLSAHHKDIIDCEIEQYCRNSALPLLDIKGLKARIEPGAIIRSPVTIGTDVIIMMGAIINVGAIINDETMIDMGAIIGGRALVGKRCHIGAGAVLAGVIEPPSAKPVIIEDDVLIGANAVVIEGVHIGAGAVVAAGAVVIEDVPSNMVVAGMPAKIIKRKDDQTAGKTMMISALRQGNNGSC